MKNNTMRRATLFLLLMMCLCLVVGSLQPFDLALRTPSWPGWHQSPPADFLWNIAAYIPLGVCSCLLLGRRLSGVALAVLLGVAMGLALECAQSLSASRVSSWVDVISNGLGTTLGAGLAAILARSEKPTTSIDIDILPCNPYNRSG